MSAAIKAIDWLERQGVSISTDGQKLILSGEAELSPKVMARIIELKPLIIEALHNAGRSNQDTPNQQIDYALLQAIADARNDNAEQWFETDRFCKCGQFASTQWRVNGTPTWLCDQCI